MWWPAGPPPDRKSYLHKRMINKPRRVGREATPTGPASFKIDKLAGGGDMGLLGRLFRLCRRRRPVPPGPAAGGVLAETRAWEREQPVHDAELPGADGVHAERRAAEDLEGRRPGCPGG
jgi:hypothetical protein